MAAVITRCNVASSIVGVKVKVGSEVGLGDGVFTLRSLSLGVSFRFGSAKNADGFGEEDDCERVTRVSGAVAAVSDVAVAAASVVVASVGAVAAGSACSSSPHGHM